MNLENCRRAVYASTQDETSLTADSELRWADAINTTLPRPEYAYTVPLPNIENTSESFYPPHRQTWVCYIELRDRCYKQGYPCYDAMVTTEHSMACHNTYFRFLEPKKSGFGDAGR